ncbi:MAG: hypothetical protein AAF499_17760, partial [Pseudomonadota bacterium]
MRVRSVALSALCAAALLAPLSRASIDNDPQTVVRTIEDAAHAVTRLKGESERLAEQIGEAPVASRPSLEESLTNTRDALQAAKRRFDQLATGGVDMSVFAEDSEDFDWQSDVLDTLRPMFDNLKRLTEKPRQISDLRTRIERLEEQYRVAEGVLRHLDTVLLELGSDEADATAGVQALNHSWFNPRDPINQQQEQAA